MKTIEDLASRTELDGECWRWTGAHIPTGYGHVKHEGKTRGVHRVMYELTHGSIPDGMDIDHSCFVRDCINPNHLEAVTHHENIARSTRAGRTIFALKDPDFCLRGHARSPENTKLVKGAKQGCRICRTEDASRRKTCVECGKEITSRNMAAHIKRKHGQGDAA